MILFLRKQAGDPWRAPAVAKVGQAGGLETPSPSAGLDSGAFSFHLSTSSVFLALPTRAGGARWRPWAGTHEISGLPACHSGAQKSLCTAGRAWSRPLDRLRASRVNSSINLSSSLREQNECASVENWSSRHIGGGPKTDKRVDEKTKSFQAAKFFDNSI